MKNFENQSSDVLLIGFEGQENLGLRSIAAFLVRAGVSVDIQYLQGASRHLILERIRATDPRIVGFSLIFQRMLDDYAGLIEYLRDHGVTTHFTMGGHFPTFAAEHLLHNIPGLDSVVRHEGEVTLLELFKQLEHPERWTEIRGLAFRHQGMVHFTPARPLIANLDSLPFPLRDREGPTHRGLGIRSIAGSRGCYYDCTFCSIHEFYKGAKGAQRRTRSPANLVTEMEELYRDYDVRIFIFQDDDIFMRGRWHREWLDTLLCELQARRMSQDILWRVSCRVDDVDAEMLLRMKDAGLASIYLGIESGSETGLQVFNKRYHVDDIYKTLEVLREVDIPFEFGFMLFEPQSTMATVRDNIEFLKRIGDYGDSLVHFCKMSPYAGTPIARQLAAAGRLEGTVACPDYRFLDPRLDLLQLFYAQTFGFRNFDDHGLVERLRYAKFDVSVVEKFFAARYDAQGYRASVSELVRRSNDGVLETMSLAASLMEEHRVEDIIHHWSILNELRENERLLELRLTHELEGLMQAHEFEASFAPRHQVTGDVRRDSAAQLHAVSP